MVDSHYKFNEIIACPISKQRMILKNDKYWSESLKCDFNPADMDFRILKNNIADFQKFWAWGQKDYEEWEDKHYLNNPNLNLLEERESLKSVYSLLNTESYSGSIIDVGGGLGLAKYFFPNSKLFCVSDPYNFVDHLNLLKGCANLKQFKEIYPFLFDHSINYVCSDSEYLPFLSNIADVVHMRSCIDHFLNPEAALIEARRILKKRGHLIVGNSLETELGDNKIVLLKENIKNIIKRVFGKFEHDHHTWHPTIENLEKLFESTGFKIIDKIFQPSFEGKVVYYKLGIKN